MSIRVQTWVWDHSQSSGNDLLVLLAIADEADDDGTNAFPSIDRLTRKARINRATTMRVIKRLEDMGELLVTRPERHGRGRYNVYAIPMRERSQIATSNNGPERSHIGRSDDEERSHIGRSIVRPDPLTHELPIDPLKTSVAVNDDTDDVRAVFDAWVQSTGKTRAVLDSKRRARIVGALKNFTVDELVDAVRGWRHSPHHRGENERRTVYNDLDLLLRDAARIEKFRDLERGAAMPAPPRVSKSHTNISAVADRLREVEREQERSRNGAQAADRQLLP